jgi:hypothetical protein
MELHQTKKIVKVKERELEGCKTVMLWEPGEGDREEKMEDGELQCSSKKFCQGSQEWHPTEILLSLPPE